MNFLKKITGNIIKGTISSLIGVATMIVTLILIWTGAIHFIWDGVAGLSIGCILLFTPQIIETAVLELIKSWGKQARGMFGFGMGDEDGGRDITNNGEGNQKP